MSTESSIGKTRSVKLSAIPAPGGGARRPATFYLPIKGGRGVDLGAVGRALGLKAATVRLNGYYLSCGPDHVSAVTWDVLLSFFASRGLATGGCDGDPVSVEGSPLAFSGSCCPSDWRGGYCLSSKRKARLEDEIAVKKNWLNECGLSPLRAGQSDENLCIKRRLELADVDPLKKQKIDECNSRTANSNDQQVGNDYHFLIKRRSELEDDKRLEKQKISWCNSGMISFRDRKVSSVNSLCIKRKPVLLEGVFKKQKITKCNSGMMDFRNRRVSFPHKRSSNLEDNEPLKKQRLRECTPVYVAPIFPALNQEDESTPSCINGRRIVMFVLHQYPSTANRRQIPFQLTVACHGGVDLGAIGKYLRLDPRTLKLNSYFLGRSPDLVSSLTWDTILSFFASRGFPIGDSDCNPIIVHGKPLTTQDTKNFSGVLSDLEDGDCKSFKRMVGLDYEIPCKVTRATEVERRDGKINPDSPCVRRPSSDDDKPFKKSKTTGSYSGLANDGSTAWKNGFNHSCFKEHGKHLRDVMVPAVSCVRIL